MYVKKWGKQHWKQHVKKIDFAYHQSKLKIVTIDSTLWFNRVQSYFADNRKR